MYKIVVLVTVCFRILCAENVAKDEKIAARSPSDTYLDAYSNFHSDNQITTSQEPIFPVYSRPQHPDYAEQQQPTSHEPHYVPEPYQQKPISQYEPTAPISSYGGPLESNYGAPSAPNYGVPLGPNHGAPSGTGYGAPPEPGNYGPPSGPSYRPPVRSPHKPHPPPVYGPPNAGYGPPNPEYGPPHPPPPRHHYGPPSHYQGPPLHHGHSHREMYGPPHHLDYDSQPNYGMPYGMLSFFDKLKFKLDIYTIFKIILKLIIFKKIIKFIAILCLLLFIPHLKKKKGHHNNNSDEDDDTRRNFNITPAEERIDMIAKLVTEAINYYSEQNSSRTAKSQQCTSIFCRVQRAFKNVDKMYPIKKLLSMYSSEKIKKSF